jgi:hypothetical protein
MTRKNANRTDPISTIMVRYLYNQIGLCMLFNLNGTAITFYGILVEYALKLQGGAEPLQICARPVVQRGSAVSTPDSLHTVVDVTLHSNARKHPLRAAIGGQ